jgi:ABC-type transport system involved in cytochrome bd biosynthesis fused ATPase/permease subunit
MNSDLKNILFNSNKDIDNQQLMDYLSKQASEADTHDLEQSMVENDFLNDAIEGLQEIKPSQNLDLYVEQLNRELQNQLKKTKKRRNKHRIKDRPYAIFAVMLILLLAVVCYMVWKKSSRHLPLVHPVTSEMTTKVYCTTIYSS